MYATVSSLGLHLKNAEVLMWTGPIQYILETWNMGGGGDWIEGFRWRHKSELGSGEKGGGGGVEKVSLERAGGRGQ